MASEQNTLKRRTVTFDHDQFQFNIHEIGRKIARQNAVQKIWPLEGYLLREKLATAEALL